MKKHIFSILISSLFILLQLNAQENHKSPGSPYFLLQTEGVKPENFSLSNTSATVNIAGPIADVEIIQTYQNLGTQALEAIYVFPASTRAAVYAMEMVIGERIIKAEIKEKQKARELYEHAKDEGKRTSLLEQHNANVFQMNLANIMPGDIVEVRMKYNEFLIPDGGQYQFVFPTVVGPRFASSDSAPQYVSNPYLRKGTKIPYGFDLKINLNSPVPILRSFSPSHKMSLTYHSSYSLELSLDKGQETSGNKDFIFNFQLSDKQIVSGTMLYEHGDENFFLSIIEPPKHNSFDEIPPREYIFIVDVSGSMHGFPINISKKLMRSLLGNMRGQDYFNVLLFASNSSMLSSKSVLANPSNIQKAAQLLDQESGSGSTQLLPAIKQAMNMPKHYENTSRTLVIITDGYVHVEKEAFEFIENNLGKANFFAFGIGSSVNRFIIEGIAHVGKGKDFIVTDQHTAAETASRFRTYVEAPLLTNIKMTFEDMEIYDVTPKYIPDLLSERPIYVFGKYRGKPSGSIHISGMQASNSYKNSIHLSQFNSSKKNAAIRYLWAREKIRYNADFYKLDRSEIHKNEITALGLKYNLLSEFTSFVAVDHSEMANQTGKSAVNGKQALPLPEGVSNYAVGFEMSADGWIEADAELEEALLFVNVLKKLDSELLAQIQSFIQKQFRFTDMEARILLDGNQLEIQIQDGCLSINESNGLLSPEMINKIATQLNGLTLFLNNIQFKIQLIWL